MGFKVKLTLYGSLHSSIVRTEGVTWKIGGIKAFCLIRVYHGCQKFTWFLIIDKEPRQQGAKHLEKRPPSILVFWERTFWAKVIQVKLKRNIYILKVLMLVPSHLYSPFCEPFFVKGGVFHSGKIAFNTYACIQFTFKTGELSVVSSFLLRRNFSHVQIMYLLLKFNSPRSIY